MPIIPKIPQAQLRTKRCAKCGATHTDDQFTKTRSIFYPDGLAPVCNNCINDYLREGSYSWDYVDKVCRWLDIPFIVREWTRIVELNGEDKAWPVYSSVFAAEEYESLGWKDYYTQYVHLRETNTIEHELPLVHEATLAALRKKWGGNYDESQLYYLEDLYKGLLVTQNVNGALQQDQAQKLCKISLEIDSRIRAGDKDVDKFLSSYEKLVKIAEFTPKNTKNAVDFDSFAEVALWLEKRGRVNKFYDNTTRDVIDETLKNIENYNQRLYINEGGIGDEITERLKILNTSSANEDSIYDIQQEYDLDEYDNAGFTMEENEEFVVEDEGDE